MEKDFKLCENEGLFQEYLEMGKKRIVHKYHNKELIVRDYEE